MKIKPKELLGDISKKTIIYILGAVGLLLLAGTSFVKDKAVPIEDKNTENSNYCKELEERLEEILPEIAGVGNVNVMITAENYGEVEFAKDQKNNSNETVVLNMKGGGEDAKIVEEKYPKIKGVIIVADGGKSDRVKNEITEAICALLGVEPHKIKVFERKIT